MVKVMFKPTRRTTHRRISHDFQNKLKMIAVADASFFPPLLVTPREEGGGNAAYKQGREQPPKPEARKEKELKKKKLKKIKAAFGPDRSVQGTRRGP